MEFVLEEAEGARLAVAAVRVDVAVIRILGREVGDRIAQRRGVRQAERLAASVPARSTQYSAQSAEKLMERNELWNDMRGICGRRLTGRSPVGTYRSSCSRAPRPLVWRHRSASTGWMGTRGT